MPECLIIDSTTGLVSLPLTAMFTQGDYESPEYLSRLVEKERVVKPQREYVRGPLNVVVAQIGGTTNKTYRVEAITDRRKPPNSRHNQYEYLVHWKDHPGEESWEPVKMFGK